MAELLMRPRLSLLWGLLSDEGSLWISIDDDEQAYMKVLCDELFGRSSFIASIIWQKRTSPDMRAIISDGHDYILVYAKNREMFKENRNKLPLTEEQAKGYKNPDNDRADHGHPLISPPRVGDPIKCIPLLRLPEK